MSEISEDYNAKLQDLRSRALPFSLGNVYRYVSGKTTPARMLADFAAADLIPLLKGDIIEIGGRLDYYSRFAGKGSKYIVSNISDDPQLMYLDAMDMHLQDESVDSFVCISALEHMPDPFKSVKEMRRTLKKGGKLLLIVPFIYPYHADPSDFYRFSDKGLAVMLKDFKILRAESLGNIFSTLALLLQRPFRASFLGKWRRQRRVLYFTFNLATGPVAVICRIVGLVFYLSSYMMRGNSDYASMYCVLAEK